MLKWRSSLHTRKVLDYWIFFSNTAGPLPYNIKGLEMTLVVFCYHSTVKRVLLKMSVPLTLCCYFRNENLWLSKDFKILTDVVTLVLSPYS